MEGKICANDLQLVLADWTRTFLNYMSIQSRKKIMEGGKSKSSELNGAAF